jgi:hypothetical protein
MTKRAAIDLIDPPVGRADAMGEPCWPRAAHGRGLSLASPPAPATKRLSIDVPAELHTRIKVICARRGTKIADEVRALLEKEFRHLSW